MKHLQLIDITPAATLVELPASVKRYISPRVSSVLQYMASAYISYRMFRNYNFSDGKVTTQSDYLPTFINYNNLKARVSRESIKELYTYTAMIYDYFDKLFSGVYHQTEYLDDEAINKRPAVPYQLDMFYETSIKVVSKKVNGKWCYLLTVV